MVFIIALPIVVIILALTALALNGLEALKRRTAIPDATTLVISCLIWASCIIMNVIVVYRIMIIAA